MRPCLKCGSDSVTQAQEGPHIAERCGKCGKWKRFVSRTEAGVKPRTVQTTHQAIRPALRARILERANGQCEVCGVSGVRMQVSHILSVSECVSCGIPDADANSDENLICCCEECNLGQGSRVIPLRLAVAIVMRRLRREMKE